jgi:hypothetical protein
MRVSIHTHIHTRTNTEMDKSSLQGILALFTHPPTAIYVTDGNIRELQVLKRSMYTCIHTKDQHIHTVTLSQCHALPKSLALRPSVHSAILTGAPTSATATINLSTFPRVNSRVVIGAWDANRREPVFLCVPNIRRNTFASVPASFMLLVYTVTSY